MTSVTPDIPSRTIASGGAPLLIAGAVVLGLGVVAGGAWAIIVLVGALAFLLFLRNPVLGLYITTALLLLSGASGVLALAGAAVPVTGAKICGFITLLAWLVNLVLKKQPLRVTWEVSLLALFFAWAAFGVAVSPTGERQWPEWFRLGTLVAFFIMTVHLLDTPQRMRRYTMVIAVCGLFMAAYAVIQYFVPALHLATETAIEDVGRGAEGAFIDYDSLQGGPGAVRVTGRAGHSNWLAMILLLILPLNVYWYQISRSWQGRYLALFAVAIEVLALIFTFTRTGFIVGVTILAIVTARRLVRITPVRVCGALLALYLAWFFLPSAYKERVLDFTRYEESESISHRAELQTAAFEFMLERPIQGHGIGGFGFRLLDADYTVSDILHWLVETEGWNPLFYGSHNMYLQVGSEFGFVGLAMFLAFFAIMLRRLRKTELAIRESGGGDMKTLVMSLQVSLWSFVLCAVFLHALQQKIWWMLAALATALYVHCARNGMLRPAAPPVSAVKVDVK